VGAGRQPGLRSTHRINPAGHCLVSRREGRGAKFCKTFPRLGLTRLYAVPPRLGFGDGRALAADSHETAERAGTCRTGHPARRGLERVVPKEAHTVAKPQAEARGWIGRNLVTCIRESIAAWSATGSVTMTRLGMRMANSGCLTRCRSPLDITTSNGSNGRQFSISRIASAFIVSAVQKRRLKWLSP